MDLEPGMEGRIQQINEIKNPKSFSYRYLKMDFLIVWGVDLESGMGGGRIQGNKKSLRKSEFIFLTIFADGFGSPGE